MKKVLMVAYSFPPLKYPGAERAGDFAAELHNYGWEPLVLTCDVNTGSSLYTDKLAVPERTDIIRTNPWEPENLPHIFQASGRFLSSLPIPDNERLWQIFSSRRSARIVKNEGIDLIYTVSPPFSAHLTGLRLKKKYPGLPWVADLCSYDIVAAGEAYSSRSLLQLKDNCEKKLRNKIAEYADCVIVDNNTLLENFTAGKKDSNRHINACMLADGHTQELSELFEKACRSIAARKLETKRN